MVQASLVTTVVIIVSIIFNCAASNPIIIRSGIVKNQGRSDAANTFDLTHHKGLANFEGEEGFNKNNEHKLMSAEDIGTTREENKKNSQKLDKNNYDDEKYFEDNGGHISDYGSKAAHKKGHHKTGFHNTYHKDETGSNSSYYDDAGDEGDEYIRKSNKGSYGNNGQHQQHNDNLNSEDSLRSQGKHAQYDNTANYEKDLANRQNYNQKNYYNNREDHARRNAGNQYDEGGRFAQEKYYQEHPDYYYDQPYNQKKRITIYEDPRIYDYDQPRYNNYDNNDYVEIEVKRPPIHNDYRRYNHFDRRPFYNYY